MYVIDHTVYGFMSEHKTGGCSPTHGRQYVVKGIWNRAPKGKTKSLEALMSPLVLPTPWSYACSNHTWLFFHAMKTLCHLQIIQILNSRISLGFEAKWLMNLREWWFISVEIHVLVSFIVKTYHVTKEARVHWWWCLERYIGIFVCQCRHVLNWNQLL